jgi:zinc D-Ala-D-Ala carboxypeptidase
MNLTPHFTVAEFTDSDTAVRLGIDNSLPATMMVAAQDTCELLERIRDKLSKLAGRDIAMVITSGYRCPDLNAAVGGQPASDHQSGWAVDFRAPAFGSPYEICRALVPHVSELGIGQVIHEFGRWVHVSTRRPSKDLNRIITISRRGTELGIQEA